MKKDKITTIEGNIPGFKVNEITKGIQSVQSIKRSCEDEFFNKWIIIKSCGKDEIILNIIKGSIKSVKDFNPKNPLSKIQDKEYNEDFQTIIPVSDD